MSACIQQENLPFLYLHTPGYEYRFVQGYSSIVKHLCSFRRLTEMLQNLSKKTVKCDSIRNTQRYSGSCLSNCPTDCM